MNEDDASSRVPFQNVNHNFVGRSQKLAAVSFIDESEPDDPPEMINMKFEKKKKRGFSSQDEHGFKAEFICKGKARDIDSSDELDQHSIHQNLFYEEESKDQSDAGRNNSRSQRGEIGDTTFIKKYLPD